MKTDQMQDRILELCAEDDYGFWELAWAVGIQSPSDDAIETFYQKVAELVVSGIIVSKRRNPVSARLEAVAFNPNELLSELHRLNKPDPKSDYWFGTREV